MSEKSNLTTICMVAFSESKKKTKTKNQHFPQEKKKKSPFSVEPGAQQFFRRMYPASMTNIDHVVTSNR